MPKEINIQVSPEVASEMDQLILKVQSELALSPGDISELKILRRSVDARQRKVKINLRLKVYIQNETVEPDNIDFPLQDVSEKEAVVIIGAGPAGMFAALKLIEFGFKPIIIERGKKVRDRRRDLVKITRNEKVDEDSNYCFGEGGAGTYSDGKLYTRSGNKKWIRSILKKFVFFGADQNILVNAHPHIGTNKLPGIIEKMRESILDKGGEIHFEQRLTEFKLENGIVSEAVTMDGSRFKADHFILATGHSARDIFEYLPKIGIPIEFKPFALGVRVEHPQTYIDQMQYHCEDRGPYLEPASYALVSQIENKGVYSFCMCPGGIIAPCATSNEEVVTNGWSPSKRNNPFANSGIVTQVEWEDIPEFHSHGALAGVEFQKSVERSCWESAGKSQIAPAQMLSDFVEGKLSPELSDCSYRPDITSVRLDKILPKFIVERLQKGFVDFNKKIKGFIHAKALVVGPESRTSSPVRIPRDPISLLSLGSENLYPCAEGAGYAGGIVSAAIDGEKVAIKIAEKVNADKK